MDEKTYLFDDLLARKDREGGYLGKDDTGLVHGLTDEVYKNSMLTHMFLTKDVSCVKRQILLFDDAFFLAIQILKSTQSPNSVIFSYRTYGVDT